MIELSRTVRFCLNGPGAAVAGPEAPARHNTFAAWPAMRGLGRFYELHVRCRGLADPVTGYFINIHQIDEAVRQHVLPYLIDLLDSQPASASIPLGAVMRRILELLQPPLGRTVRRVRMDLTPYLNLTIRSDDMAALTMRQQYEFCAAHRLHVPELSAAENQRVFGKCNNPSGHGHNYRLEVAVRVPIDPAGRTLAGEDLDAVVDEAVIEKLDHKHLNTDVPQFAELNPSVENIARVVYEMLEPSVARLGVTLAEVSVWETSKTKCTYSGAGASPAEQAASAAGPAAAK